MVENTINNGVEFKPKTPIQNFYKGETVLVTGGTGFLGKMLIEKLLRACIDVDRLYILVRFKKNTNPVDRIERMFEDPVFDTMKKLSPMWREKVVAVSGDCTKPGLGLSEMDRITLQENISIVFHLAATVRFNEKLQHAVAINVGGTRELLRLCTDMKKLKCVVHVSTAFSYCISQYVEEKFYEPPFKSDTILDLAQRMSEDDLEAISDKFVIDFPNTYTYTKCIAEDVVREYGRNLPIGIFRPAIVLSSYKEPIEGWCSNIFGPSGVYIGAGTGLIRIFQVDVDKIAQIIPADLTINSLIALPWDIVDKNRKGDTEIPIYNYHSNWTNGITWKLMINESINFGYKIPSAKSLWYMSLTTTKSTFWYKFLVIILHILPGIFMDLVLLFIGQKPRMMKTYKRIHKHLSVLVYFSTREWTFSNPNTQKLWDKLDVRDRELFYFSMKDFDWEDYILKYVQGLRLHIFKEDISTIPMARKRQKILMYLHYTVKYSLFALLAWLLYCILHFIYAFASTIFQL